VRGAARKALRLDCARQAEDILRVAISIWSKYRRTAIWEEKGEREREREI
jgi:hypothetical protein